jgi:hypothetical protein
MSTIKRAVERATREVQLSNEVEIYDDIEETHCSLQQLTDSELIDCRKVLEKRLGKVLLNLQSINFGNDIGE